MASSRSSAWSRRQGSSTATDARRASRNQDPDMAENLPFGIAGLLGWPVAHSRSPTIHNYWLKEHGLAGPSIPFPGPPGKMWAAPPGPPALGPPGGQRPPTHQQAARRVVPSVDPAG